MTWGEIEESNKAWREQFDADSAGHTTLEAIMDEGHRHKDLGGVTYQRTRKRDIAKQFNLPEDTFIHISYASYRNLCAIADRHREGAP